jgi:hypothetical protein
MYAQRSPARIESRTSAVVSGTVVSIAPEATTAVVEAPRYTAGWTLTLAVCVLSAQCTSTPVKGAVGESSESSQHPCVTVGV